uniref:Uncharacterized protein n=1 Tax=Planktothricoides sp. SpSt-374 TaxID=2282167 RepID=A0A7C3VMH3_9CYAN
MVSTNRIRLKPLSSILSLVAGMVIAGCNSIVTDRYQATAEVQYRWQVSYTTAQEKFPRRETFAANSLTNINGQKPQGAITGPDDKGLWWPSLPPRPTVEEMEQRQQPGENIGTPELNKSVEYKLSYQVGQETVTLPTNHQVYRAVAKAYPERLPLKFTLGVGDASVDKAETQ